MLYLGDDQAHLQAPVPQMHIPDHIMPGKAQDPLDALADDGRAQMSHMKRFCHIGSAVVDDDLFARRDGVSSQAFIQAHAPHIIRHKLTGKLQVEESRFHSLDRLEHAATVFRFPCLFQDRRHMLRDHDGCLVIQLRAGHGAVALVLAKIRPVGELDPAKRRVVPCLFKSCLYLRFYTFTDLFHVVILSFCPVCIPVCVLPHAAGYVRSCLMGLLIIVDPVQISLDRLLITAVLCPVKMHISQFLRKIALF